MPFIDRSPQFSDEGTKEVKPVETQENTTPVEETTSTNEESSTSEQITPEETSIEADTSEKTVEAPTENEDKKEPWDVDAIKLEREKVLNELKELRKERRELRNKEVFVEEPRTVEPSKELEGIAESDVQLIEKVLKAKGYVKKDDVHQLSYVSQRDSVTDAWLEKHPEYKPENDPEDEKWNALKAEISLYRPPTNPKEWSILLDKAHKILSGSSSLPLKSRASIEASKERISTSSKGSVGGGTKTMEKQVKIPHSEYLLGFSDEEKKELFS